MIAYDVWLADGSYRFASAVSKLAAAELALDGPALPHRPAGNPQGPADCVVSEQNRGDDAEEPFWRAEKVETE